MPLAVLVRAHHGGGKPPAEAFGFREDLIVRDYIAAAENRLIEAGWDVLIVSGCTYNDALNASDGADVFVHCHTNSGRETQPDHYGAVFYRKGDEAGKSIAGHVRSSLQLLAVDRALRIEASPAGWTAGAYYVIRGAECPALTYEPFFIDAIEASGLRAYPQPAGFALADGLCAWWRSRNG